MSRIHEALKKAEVERESAGIAPRAAPPLREAGPLRSVPEIADLRPLADRNLAVATLTNRGRSVLARSYDSLERLCGLERGLVMGPAGGAVRSVLVAAVRPDGWSAAVALALAATLAEKARSRALVVDLETGGGGLAELCRSDGRGEGGFWDVSAGLEPLRCVRRTELSGLYVLPPGSPPAERDGRAAPPGAERAVGALLEHFPFALFHAGWLDERRIGGFADLVDALLLVSAPGDMLDGDSASPSFNGKPVHVVHDLG